MACLKKYFCFFGLLLITAQGRAQDSLYKAKLGLEFSLVKSRYNALSLFPSLSCTFGRHTVFGGPGYYYLYNDQEQPFVGFQAGYQLELTGSETIKLFVEYDLNYAQGRQYKSFFAFNVQESAWAVRDRTIDMASLDNYFSAGLHIAAGRFLYVKPVMGLGIGLYRENFKYTFYNRAPLSESGGFSYRYPGGLTAIGKLTIGFNLVHIRKK